MIRRRRGGGRRRSGRPCAPRAPLSLRSAAAEPRGGSAAPALLPLTQNETDQNLKEPLHSPVPSPHFFLPNGHQPPPFFSSAFAGAGAGAGAAAGAGFTAAGAGAGGGGAAGGGATARGISGCAVVWNTDGVSSEETCLGSGFAMSSKARSSVIPAACRRALARACVPSGKQSQSKRRQGRRSLPTSRAS